MILNNAEKAKAYPPHALKCLEVDKFPCDTIITEAGLVLLQ